jgi:hypothetical protein
MEKDLVMMRLKQQMLRAAVNAVEVFKTADKNPKKSQAELQSLWERQRLDMGLPTKADERYWK